MKEKDKRIKNSFTNFFELPKEVMLDLPKVTVVGNIQLSLENHRGVIEYNTEIIRLRINSGEIIIKGDNLNIRNLGSEDIHIVGEIFSIVYEL